MMNTVPLYKFPQKFAQNAMMAYFAALLLVSLRFSAYAMSWYWWLFGIVGVVGFFIGAATLSKKWLYLSEKKFEQNVFGTALLLRIIMVFILYWFFNLMTGKPFMFSAADSFEYGEEAKWMAQTIRDGQFSEYWGYLMSKGGISDAGYPLWLGSIYYLTGDSVIVARLLKAVLSSFMCVLVYRLTQRNFGEAVGRLAAIFCMLEPHFIIYCGQHLKETEMLFLLILFLERTDNLLRARTFRFWAVLPVLLIGLVLFAFRTVLGAAAMFATIIALILSSKRVVDMKRRWVILIVMSLGAIYMVGGRIAVEVEEYWNARDSNQANRFSQIQRKQGLAQYATKAVFAPMIFTIPFPTMVETAGQENSRLQHAGFVAKNVLSFFCILALFTLIFNRNQETNWRNHVLLGAYLIAYLAILIQSAFAHSDRFHLPAYIIELIFAAYGVTLCNTKRKQSWFTMWCVLMFVAWIGWNWFKLKGRGMA